MSLLLPITSFYGMFFLFSLFFPPSSAALYAAVALGLTAFVGTILQKHALAFSVGFASRIALGACVAAFGITSLAVFALYESIDHLRGGGPTPAHWFFCGLAILVAPLLVRRFALPFPVPIAYGYVLGYALLFGGTVALVEVLPVLRWVIGALAVVGLVVDRRHLLGMAHFPKDP